MRRCCFSVILASLGVLLGCQVTAADTPIVIPRVALLPGTGERAPAEAALAQVEAALSADRGLALLERQQVSKILAEHQLAAAGLLDHGIGGRLGQFLPADLFVFIEKLPSNVVMWRVQIIEARTGMILHSLAEKASDLQSQLLLLREAVRLAAAKWGALPERRHWVALLSVRPEEAGRALEPTATALSVLLPVDLNNSPDLVLLDREHLDRLREEERLTARETSLKTSAVLLEVGLKHATNRLRVSLVFRPLVDGKAVRSELLAPTNDFKALREAVRDHVFEYFRTAAPANSTAIPRDEAVAFARRAQVLFSFGQAEEAVRAAEAAVALYPHPTICDVALQCWDSLRSGLLKPIGAVHNMRRVKRGDPGYVDHPRAVKERFLKSTLRAFDLEDLSKEFAMLYPQEATNRLPVFGGTTRGGVPCTMEIHPEETDLAEMRQEIFERTLARHYRRLSELEANWNKPFPTNLHGDHPQLSWIREMTEGIGKLKMWAPDEKQWAKYMPEEIKRYLHPPGPITERYGSSKGIGWVWFAENFQSYCVEPPENRHYVRQVLENLPGQTNAVIHLAVRHALLFMNFMDPQSEQQTCDDSRALLDVFLREMPLSHPCRHWNKDSPFPRIPVFWAFYEIREKSDAKRYGKAVIEPILESGDWERLEVWGEVFTLAVKLLSPEERRAWRELMLSKLADPAVREALPEGGVVEQFLKAEAADRFPPRNSWKDYKVALLLSTNAPPGEIMTTKLDKDTLMLVWLSPVSSNQALVTVTRLPLSGGVCESLGSVTMFATNVNDTRITSSQTSPPNGRSYLRFRSKRVPYQCYAAVDEQAVYVATPGGGLAMFGSRGVKTFTRTNGLPMDAIYSLATLGGKVFIGGSGLFEFDPATEKFRELASNFTTQERNILDGGRSYQLNSLWPDESGENLYVEVGITMGRGVTFSGSTSQRWCYKPKTGEFEPVKYGVGDAKRPRLGDEEFAGGDGLFIYQGERQPPKVIMQLPDGRPLSPIRALYSHDQSTIFALPREVWCLRKKANEVNHASPGEGK